MGGNGYSADDNRSMQLNDNNERYYSSRGVDRYDDDDSDSEEEYNRNTGRGKPPDFQAYIPLEDWLPYFKVWIKNLKINSDKPYIRESDLTGGQFIGFDYWNDAHRKLWFYYRTIALIDYCTDKGNGYTVMENGFLWEYRVQDWGNFAFDGSNIMAVNRMIYENNGLEFPSNAFLAKKIMRDTECLVEEEQ